MRRSASPTYDSGGRNWRITNAPGFATPQALADVEELLEAGINVYTTVNVQHLESLNDVVAQITGTIVRETVPDSILERQMRLS